MTKRPISLFATGVRASVGGIASANRNVSAALGRLARETDRTLLTYAFDEEPAQEDGYRAFGAEKGDFALATLKGALRSGIVLFDHVRLALPMLALPALLRPPVVIFAHGSESWKRIKPLSIRAFRGADLVLTNSNFTLGKMRSRFSGFNGVACPLGLPPQFVLTPAPPPRATQGPAMRAADGSDCPLGPRVMILVGRMDAGEQEKGHRELIEALPGVVSQVPDAQLVFVGVGSDTPALQALAANSSAASRIAFAGRVDDGLLAALYAAAYAFVMPSRQEGFGLVYLEAMNYALPCLACRDDGGADVVVDGETGVLVDQPINPKQLTNAIVALLSDPEGARRMGEAGWRRLNSEFSAAAHQARVLELVRPLIR